MNLRTIPDLETRFGCPIGLSDHTLGHEVAVAAVTIGAKIIEKHLTLSRQDGGPDSIFSMEPPEFKQMVQAIRVVEKALGCVSYKPTAKELIKKEFRRSLFVVKDMKKGERFSKENVRSIRPAAGLKPKYYPEIIGKQASDDLAAGTPLSWKCVETGAKETKRNHRDG